MEPFELEHNERQELRFVEPSSCVYYTATYFNKETKQHINLGIFTCQYTAALAHSVAQSDERYRSTPTAAQEWIHEAVRLTKVLNVKQARMQELEAGEKEMRALKLELSDIFSQFFNCDCDYLGDPVSRPEVYRQSQMSEEVRAHAAAAFEAEQARKDLEEVHCCLTECIDLVVKQNVQVFKDDAELPIGLTPAALPPSFLAKYSTTGIDLKDERFEIRRRNPRFGFDVYGVFFLEGNNAHELLSFANLKGSKSVKEMWRLIFAIALSSKSFQCAGAVRMLMEREAHIQPSSMAIPCPPQGETGTMVSFLHALFEATDAFEYGDIELVREKTRGLMLDQTSQVDYLAFREAFEFFCKARGVELQSKDLSCHALASLGVTRFFDFKHGGEVVAGVAQLPTPGSCHSSWAAHQAENAPPLRPGKRVRPVPRGTTVSPLMRQRLR